MSEAVETAKLGGSYESGARTDAELNLIKARPLVGSAPTKTPRTAQASKKVSTSVLGNAIPSSRRVPSHRGVSGEPASARFRVEWVNTGAVACMALAVVGFFAAPRAH